MRTAICLLPIALAVISCRQGGAQESRSAALELETYTYWETKYDEHESDTEYWELTIPGFFGEDDAATVQLYHHGTENNYSNSTISLMDKEGDFLTTLFEPTQFHEMAVQYTTLSVGDIDGNGLKDIKIEFPHMGNGLMACAVRTIYIFQEEDKTFNKISFDSFACREDVSEVDVNGDGKYEIVARTLQYIDEENSYWVDNLYKYTPEGLVCVSKENGYPKAVNVYEDKPTDAEIVAKHKEEWTVEQLKRYLFLTSSDPEAGFFTQPPRAYDGLENAGWTKYRNDEFGYRVAYPDLDFEPIALGGSTVQFGDLFSISVNLLSDEENRLGSPDKILRERYEVLDNNPQWVTLKNLKGKQYGYADFYGYDHPNIKSRAVIALCHNGVHVYELYCDNPDDETAKVFQKIVEGFQIVQE